MVDLGMSLAPLLRWDGLHLVLNLRMVEGQLTTWLEGTGHVRDLRVRGFGETVELAADLTWKGVTTRAVVEVGELRVNRRHLGLRIRRVRAVGGLRFPRRVLERILDRIDSPLVRVVHGQGIVVVDLGQWIPADAVVRVVAVQATDSSLHVWFGPGEVRYLPLGRQLALEPGPEAPEPAGVVIEPQPS